MTDQFSGFSSGLEMTVVTRPLYQVSAEENILTRGRRVKWGLFDSLNRKFMQRRRPQVGSLAGLG
jgi:hypothetical protein